MREKIDYLYRLQSKKEYLPPWSLRYYVGCPYDFESNMMEFYIYFKLLCNLKSDEKILDIGCGCGMMALKLTEYLNENGKYVGLDISKKAIDWAKKNIQKKFSNFKFYHQDIQNKYYNPEGKIKAENYRFPFKDETYDFIFLKSVFTHMLPDEVKNYLKEIGRLLSRNGRSLVTFFLLNELNEENMRKGLSKMKFPYRKGSFAVFNREVPEDAISYQEDYILKLLNECGLQIKMGPIYGTWSGRRDGLSFQDIIIVHKKI